MMWRWCCRAIPVVSSILLCAGSSAAPAGLQPADTQAQAHDLRVLEPAGAVPPAAPRPDTGNLHTQAPLPPEPSRGGTHTISPPADPDHHVFDLSLIAGEPHFSPLLRELALSTPHAPLPELVILPQPAPQDPPAVVVPTFDEVLRGLPALNMLLIFALGLVMAHYGARALGLRR